MDKYAIVTITRNSSHILPNFISSFQRYVDREKYDLFLIDNGSRSADREIIELYKKEGIFKSIRYNEKNMLFTLSANQGINDAKLLGDYGQFIMANPDIEFCENWDKYLNKNLGIMGFTLVKDYGIIEHCGAFGGGDHIGRGKFEDSLENNSIANVEWVTFAFVAINEDVIKSIGLLDEQYPHFSSDREYCKKARKNDFDVTCSPTRIGHCIGGSTRPYVFVDIPENIWTKHVWERREVSGVKNFPLNQKELKNINWD